MAEEGLLAFVKEMLGYTDAEWETWKRSRNSLPRDPFKRVPAHDKSQVGRMACGAGCGSGVFGM